MVIAAALSAAGCGGPSKEPVAAAEEEMSAEDKAALEELEKMSRELEAAIGETRELNAQTEKALGELQAASKDAQEAVDDANRVLNGEEPASAAGH